MRAASACSPSTAFQSGFEFVYHSLRHASQLQSFRARFHSLQQGIKPSFTKRIRPFKKCRSRHSTNISEYRGIKVSPTLKKHTQSLFTNFAVAAVIYGMSLATSWLFQTAEHGLPPIWTASGVALSAMLLLEGCEWIGIFDFSLHHPKPLDGFALSCPLI